MDSAQFVKDPDRNLALELVRVTESAAMAAARKMGRGDKNAADQAAVNAMRYMFNTVDMDGVVVIGEGEKDEAPMLYNGEVLGTGVPPQVDIAVDPIDGTRLTSLGLPGAVAVVALAERGTMFNPGHIVYANKIAVGPRAKGVIDINAPVKDNLTNVAKALGKDLHDLTVVILDRDRHKDLIREVRGCGARIKLISDGDVAGALATAIENSGRRRPDGHRRLAGSRHHRGRAQVHGRRDSDQAVGARRARAHDGRRSRHRSRSGTGHQRTGQRRERLLRRHRHYRRSTGGRRAL